MNRIPDISIVIPVVRPEGGKRAAAAALRHAGIDRSRIEIIMEVDRDGIGCPRMVKKLAGQGRGRFVCFLGDDTEAEAGWLAAALEAMAGLPDGWGVVGLNTEPGNDHAHWLADRRILSLTGSEFFHVGYHHAYCDDELRDIAMENGRWAVAEKARIKHHHPINGGAHDEHYDRAYKDGAWQQDRVLYLKRRSRRRRSQVDFRLGIGFPLVDHQVPAPFFTSFVCMDKVDNYQLYYPQLPHGPWGGSIAECRNSLVEQAMLDGCTHLLMMDTDQVYPSDTLSKLLAHDVDICGPLVCKRYAPYNPIMYQGELGKYRLMSSDDMRRGATIEVEATGTGCLLIKTGVFEELDHPWFKRERIDGRPVGEDIWFCHQAREAGFRIFVDTSIEVGHLDMKMIGLVDHLLYKKLKGKAHG